MKAEQASATAYLIAESAVILSENAALKTLLEPASVKLSGHFADSRPFLKKIGFWAKQRKILRAFFNLLENLVIPGIQLHYLVRKRRIEEITLDALMQNFRQIVVFGAGFDTLALRLHKDFPVVNFLEVDYPATQAAKLNAIKSLPSVNENLNYISLDLAEKSFSEKMLDNKFFRSQTKTLFIAEGLTMYLGAPEIENLFDFIQKNSTENSRFAFTFMEKRTDNRIAFHNVSKFVDFWLKMHGEPFRWGLKHTELADFLNDRNFTLQSLDCAETFRRKYLTAPELGNLPLAEGESLCLAAVNQKYESKN